MKIIETVRRCEVCGRKTKSPLIIDKTGGDYIVRAYICSDHFIDTSTTPWKYGEDVAKIVLLVESKASELAGMNK